MLGDKKEVEGSMPKLLAGMEGLLALEGPTWVGMCSKKQSLQTASHC